MTRSLAGILLCIIPGNPQTETTLRYKTNLTLPNPQGRSAEHQRCPHHHRAEAGRLRTDRSALPAKVDSGNPRVTWIFPIQNPFPKILGESVCSLAPRRTRVSSEALTGARGGCCSPVHRTLTALTRRPEHRCPPLRPPCGAVHAAPQRGFQPPVAHATGTPRTHCGFSSRPQRQSQSSSFCRWRVWPSVGKNATSVRRGEAGYACIHLLTRGRRVAGARFTPVPLNVYLHHGSSPGNTEGYQEWPL